MASRIWSAKDAVLRAFRKVLTAASDLGRGGRIRTGGLFVPNEARYQAAPHPARTGPQSVPARDVDSLAETWTRSGPAAYSAGRGKAAPVRPNCAVPG